MQYQIRRVDYFYITVRDEPGEAYHLLDTLASLGINLLAFTAIPLGTSTTQLTIFPDNTGKIISEAKKSGLILGGPHQAFLVQGEDGVGALAEVHDILFNAKVNVFASNGVSDGKGSYGYIVYVRPDEYERAAKALNV